MPRDLALAPDTVMLLSDADRALGRLAGAGPLLPNPYLLVRPYIAREALARSRIEGTQASLSDVFDATARGNAKGEVLEVTNYIAELAEGVNRMAAALQESHEDSRPRSSNAPARCTACPRNARPLLPR